MDFKSFINKTPAAATILRGKIFVYSRILYFIIAGILFISFGLPGECFGQIVPDQFGDNPSTVHWQQAETDHFVIVFPEREASVLHDVIPKTGQIYDEYKKKLGTAPAHKITLYYNDFDEVISGVRAQNTDADYSIWTGNPLTPAPYSGEYTLTKALRIEIAYAFQASVESFPIDYWYYLFSQPSRTPWSDGLISYLALPDQTPFDVSMMRYYNYLQQQGGSVTLPLKEKFLISSGRSQIQYFHQNFGARRFADLYASRQKILGIPYFDFAWSFYQVTGIPYDFFERMWFRKVRYPQVKSKAAIAAGNEGAITLFENQDEVRTYNGLAVDADGNKIAATAFPESGSYVQQLRIISQKQNEAGKSKIIAKGYFKPQMDWNDAGQLAFAQRYYDSQNGDYYYQINLWDEKNPKPHALSNAKNALLPAFSPNGKQLVYVEKKETKDVLWLENLADESRKRIYTFDDSISVTQVDFHPARQKLLISYEVGAQNYKAGLFDLNTQNFLPFSLQAKTPLNACWAPDGRHIFFDSENEQVPNVFRAEISGNSLRKITPVTSQIMGAELMDVTQLSGQTWLVAKSGEKALFYPDKPAKSANYKAHKIEKSLGEASIKSPQKNTLDNISITPYRAFSHIKWEPPFAVPYYFNPNNFGFGTYISMVEPMRTHKVDILGLFSVTQPWEKSYFHTSYVNNSFKPQIKFDFNHLTNAFESFGMWSQIKTRDIAALSALWKLSRHSQNFTKWYAGVQLRYMGFSYFSDDKLHAHHPNIFYNNHESRQTDIKFSFVRRTLEPSRNTFIHPLSGNGARLMVTASDNILGSQTKYARLSIDGYTILPAFGDQRIFLYANAVTDLGEPAGRDYLSFTDNGDYALPEEHFMGSVNPGVKQFVRGYKNPILGDRFLFGKIEYRIPFMFNTTKKFLGFIPPARTSLTFFADGGVMGDARIAADQKETDYRYSIGMEIKHILGFGKNFKTAASAGIAQPLNKSLQFAPYVKVQSAIPF